MPTADEARMANSREVPCPADSNRGNGGSTSPSDAFEHASGDQASIQNDNNRNNQHRPPQRGIVSSENSVASNYSAFSKLNAAALAAAAGAANVVTPTNNASAILPVSEASSSRSSTVSESLTDEEKKGEDSAEATKQTRDRLSPLSSDANSSLLLHMSAPPQYPVAEFLFQLIKMLTDDNREYIEWKHSTVLVHDPPGLEKVILPKYFRHSNYSSFQRQMNYFGFRKIAGKGKMAACSYVNENASENISSLLYIKRKKTGVSGTAARLLAQMNKLSKTQGASDLDASQGGVMNNLMMMNGVNQMVVNGLGGNTVSGGMLGVNANQLALIQQKQQNANFLGGSIGLGGLQAMSGLQGMNALQGMRSGLPNMYASNLGQSAVANNNLSESSRLSNQQQILAQLQQAHASATGGLAGSSMVNTFSDPSLKNAFRNVFPSAATTGPLITNDHGSVYNMASASAGANPQAQALLMQQAAAMGGLGTFQQVSNGLGAGMSEIDAAANFRSFINHQISLFSDGCQAPAASNGGTTNNPAALNFAQQGLGVNPAMLGMSQEPMNLPQGLSYEQFFQLNGMANGAAAGGDMQQLFQR